ncbi:MAG: hypothetical protein AAGC95_01475 [Pseudomonadota bacterium]
MTAISDAVNALNEAFQLSPPSQFDGHIVFSIDGMGRLDLKEHGDELVISLAREISNGADRLAIQRTALQSVHYKHGLEPQVQASMHKNTLVFISRLSADESNVPAIDHALQQLHELHEKVRT